jgi:hypothetical protein
MQTLTETEVVRHVSAVQRYVSFTSPRYSALLKAGTVTHPIACFGQLTSAVVITVGLNPSATEFKSDRLWSPVLGHVALTERCRDYFSAKAPCRSHAWFKPWSDGLTSIGVSYEDGSAVHLDLSPRATRSVSSLNTSADQGLFLEMVERDLWVFFATMQLCKNARLILMAGSVTGKYYMNEFLQRFAPNYGYDLDRPFNRNDQRGKGKISWHCLSGPDRQLPVFFCSSSPSVGENTMLPQRLRENAPVLKQFLNGGGCSALPRI